MSTLFFSISFCLCAISISITVFARSIKLETWKLVAFGMVSFAEAVLTFFAVRSESYGQYLPYVIVGCIIALILTGNEIAYAVLYRYNNVTAASIRDAFDQSDIGFCYFVKTGRIVLCNEAMNEFSRKLQGINVLNGNEFEALLKQSPSNVIEVEEGLYVRFEAKQYNEKYTEIMAVNVTDKVKAIETLRRDNQRIDEMNRHMREYGLIMDDYIREKEILKAKIQIHDSFGGLLLTTKKVMQEESKEEIDRLVGAWINNLDLISVREPNKDMGQLDKIKETAARIGVDIQIKGQLPESEKLLDIVLLAIRECLTNAVMHADSHILFVELSSTKNMWTITLKNDGKPPEGIIALGGGLSMLDKRVKLAGGIMDIESKPEFCLTIQILEKEEKIYENI